MTLRTFSTVKNLLWNEKIPWMVKVLCGTICANKEPLFLREYTFCSFFNLIAMGRISIFDYFSVLLLYHISIFVSVYVICKS